jgi:pilus assembly protein CpaE
MSSGTPQEVIRVLIVDDIPETRENLRKLLAFEADIEVVGAAGTGREAVEIAEEVAPDVVLMDINMPDMDGITATKAISTAVRTAAVVIMSVQSEAGYLRQAMLAGARDFLTKPISGEELYATIRRVYERNAPVREEEKRIETFETSTEHQTSQKQAISSIAGAGHIIVVYSPQGGAGTTTVATNLATALIQQDTKVLLIDCNLQFGDVDTFLNLQSQLNITDLTNAIDDLDQEIVDNVLVRHGTGVKALIAPPHPEQAYDVAPGDVKELIALLSASFDYIVVDTPTQYDELTLRLFEVAERIVLLSNPTIPSVRNTRKMLDIFDNTKSPVNLIDKVVFVLNRVTGERDRGRGGTVPLDSIQTHLKQTIVATIPLDEHSVLTSVNQGVPLVAKHKTRSPGKELIELATHIRRTLEPESNFEETEDDQTRSKSAISRIFGGT